MTIQGLLDQLQATRDAEWAPEQLRAHADLRRSLEANADRARFVKPGDVVPPFVLAEVGGGTVILDDLLAEGPVTLVFHPDWMVRTESSAVLAAVRPLVGQ
ncbi:hypothetical protein [Frankia sp. R43]|uniref:hypothetical protein n=1 Tax=Frankia sp. R43 TaxID=269536 RepID=UPI0006CA14DD|nr:hypothetical protein [Frankia sp. R43]